MFTVIVRLSRTIVAFVLAAVLLVPSCDKDKAETQVKAGSGASKSKTDPVTPPSADTPPPADTKVAPALGAAATEFVSKDDGFSVMTKQQPKISKIQVPTDVGKTPTTQYMFHALGSPGAIMVMVSTFPIEGELDEAARKKTLIDARDGVVKKYNGTVSDDKTFDLDGNAGRDFKVSASHPKLGKMAVRSRMVLKGKTLYQAMHCWTRSS